MVLGCEHETNITQLVVIYSLYLRSSLSLFSPYVVIKEVKALVRSINLGSNRLIKSLLVVEHRAWSAHTFRDGGESCFMGIQLVSRVWKRHMETSVKNQILILH